MRFDSDSEPLGSFDLYLDDLHRYAPFEDRDREREVARRARAGDREAARRLVEANLRFVISYVKKYQGYGLSLKELVSIGNVGLLKAVQRFDPTRDVKFITYAVWWVRQSVVKALAEQRRSVRIPQNQSHRLHRLAEAERELTQRLGRSPTDGEVAEKLDQPLEKIRQLRQVDRPGRRFDAPLDETKPDSGTLHERHAGASEETVTEAPENRIEREQLEKLFAEHLTDRERKILVLYYGLDGREASTLGEIGTLLGITRERIRQVRNRAFRKLRQSDRRKALEQLWSEPDAG